MEVHCHLIREKLGAYSDHYLLLTICIRYVSPIRLKQVLVPYILTHVLTAYFPISLIIGNWACHWSVVQWSKFSMQNGVINKNRFVGVYKKY